jgi:MFS family permease
MAIQHPTTRTDDSGSGDGAGATLLATVRAELADERLRKDSIESRALTLAAGAAAAIALVFGLGADYSGRWQTAFFILLGLAGLLFLAASATGWWTVRLLEYKQPQLAEIRRLVKGGRVPDDADLALYVATGLMTSLEDAREKNDGKAEWLERAFALFLSGAVVVGIELMIVVADRAIG